MASNVGKIISISSTKGGVGKNTMTLNLAGIYHLLNKKVLIIDLDLYSGGVALSLNLNNKKDIFMLCDSLNNNRFSDFSEYVCKYNENIDVISAPRDPRQANKIDSKYLPIILEKAKNLYDIILIDTNHILDEFNLITLDYSYMSLFVITNDPVDLKNMKSLMTIFKDAGKTNFLTVLNNSRDTGKDYLTLFDIKNLIKTNVDYIISKNFYIRNIDKYVLNGEILTLNKNIRRFHSADINVMKQIAMALIDDKHKEGE